jgi:hypothetical protein
MAQTQKRENNWKLVSAVRANSSLLVGEEKGPGKTLVKNASKPNKKDHHSLSSHTCVQSS